MSQPNNPGADAKSSIQVKRLLGSWDLAAVLQYPGPCRVRQLAQLLVTFVSATFQLFLDHACKSHNQDMVLFWLAVSNFADALGQYVIE